MSAHLLATLVWVLSSAPCFGWADLVTPPKRPVVLYLKINAGQPARPIEEMEREAGALMDVAGYSLEWRVLPHASIDAVEAPIVVMELHGVCEAPERPDVAVPLPDSSRLASAAISNGEILPFGSVECNTLSRMLADALPKSGNKREFLYGRAMGRLVAHELYHILTKTRDHEDTGVGKSHFSVKDVLAEHFEFDSPTLAKLREPVGDAGDSEMDTIEEAGR
jgi:hypothetical protein